MTRALIAVVAITMSGAAAGPAAAQTGREEMNARLVRLVQARLEANEPVRVSADAITLEGGVLRLSGHAMVRFDDTAIRADDIVLNRGGKRVEFVGGVRAFLGAATSKALGLRPGAIQYK